MGRPLRVLIIEDSEEDTQLLLRELQRGGYEVEFERVESAEAMQSALSQKNWDLILSDYSLPTFSAPKALEVLKASSLDLPFIIVSGTIGEEIAVAALKAGANDFLVKGKFARLGPAIERELREAEIHRDRKQVEEQIKYHARLLRHINDAVIATDDRFRITAWNRAAERIYGWTAAEVMGRSADEILTSRLDEEQRAEAQELLKESGSFRSERIHSRKNGQLVYVEVNTIALTDQRGMITGYVSVNRDITERKRAEETVQQMQDRFRALTENAPDGVALIDRAGSLKFISPSARKIFGFSREETPEINPAEYTHPDDLPMVVSALSNLIEHRIQNPTLQYRFRHKDGSWLWIESTFTNLLTVKNVEAIVINFRDVTERRRAERALLKSERRYWALFEDTPIAIWEEDFSRIKQHLEQLKQEGVADFRVYFTAHPEAVFECVTMIRVSDINKAVLQMYQAESREAMLEGAAQLLRKGEWKNYYDDLVCIAEERTRNSWEGSEETLTGKPIEISLSWSVAPGYEEDFSKVIVTTIDITERKRAEKKIGQQLERLTALREIDQAITSAFDVQMSLDILLSRASKILVVDAAAVLLLDPARSTLRYGAGTGFRTNAVQSASVELGKSLAGKVVFEQRIVQIPGLVGQVDDLLQTGLLKGEDFISYHGAPLIVKGKVLGVLEAYSRSFMEWDSDWLDFFSILAGQAAIVNYNGQLFEDLQRSNAELALRVAERTAELRLTNIELEHANRAKDEFLANMSHELRTPLNSILGLSETLIERTRGPLNERQEQALQVIASSGTHLLGLINDILDVSKIEAGKLDIYSEIVAIRELCQSSLNFVKELALKKSITLEFQADPSISTLFADPQRLKQILVNLLSNAVKFTPDKGQVTLEVSTNAERDQIQFAVTDTGIGIAAEDLKK